MKTKGALMFKSNRSVRQWSAGKKLGVSQIYVRFCVVFMCLAGIVQSGCQSLPRFKTDRREAPVVMADPSDVRLVLHKVNEQSRRVEFLKTDARIAIDGMPGLRGDLLVERPDNLRLKAGLMGMSELGFDLGYNRDLFWVWKKVATPGDPSALFYAYHHEFRNSAIQEQLPLQPKWLLDGLGLFEFVDPAPEIRSRKDGMIDVVIREADGPRGTVRVSTVDPRRGLIVQQAFYDGQGRRVAYVDSQNYRYYPETQVSLPQRVKIHVFDASGRETKMVVDFGEFAVNSFHGDRENLWKMPNPDDVPMIDLSVQGKIEFQTETAERTSRDWGASYIRR